MTARESRPRPATFGKAPVAPDWQTPTTAEVVDEFDGLNKADLKALAAERGLSVSGTKAEIKARLEA